MTELIGITKLTGDAVEAQAADHVADLTAELGQWTRGKIPPLLSNAEFASISAALLVAMSRNLAECAVAFGETHGVDPVEVSILLTTMVQQNHVKALAASKGVEGAMVQ